MALISCPECGRSVSNTISACIHCGYSLKVIIDQKEIAEPTPNSADSDQKQPATVNNGSLYEILHHIDETPSTSGFIMKGNSNLVGVRGWLLFANIAIVIGLLINVSSLFMNISYYNDTSVMRIMDNDHELAFIMYYETFMSVVSVLGTIVLLVFFGKKSRMFTNSYIAVTIINVSIFVIYIVICYNNPLLTENTSSSIGRVVGHIIASAIWVNYFLKSKRVANTFIY